MKKLILIIAVLAFASTSFAATSITNAETTSIGGSPFSPSKNVTVLVTADVIAYSATSCHLSGTKEYATVGGAVAEGEDASTIFNQDLADQSGNTVCEPTAPTATNAAAFTTN